MSESLPNAPVTLDYRNPATAARSVPGAVAIMSVVLASLTILKSGLIGIGMAQNSLSFNNQTYAPVMTFQPRAAPLNQQQAAAICNFINSRPVPEPKLNRIQIADLTALLLSANQLLFYPAPPPEMPRQIIRVHEYAVPDIDISTKRGTVQLSYSGGWRITHLNVQSYKLISNTTKIRPDALTTTILEMIWLGLGVFLLIIGIRALGRNPRAASQHRLYAMIKIPAVILGALIEAGIFASDTTDMAIPWFVPLVGGALSLVYPIVLLWILPKNRLSHLTPPTVASRD